MKKKKYPVASLQMSVELKEMTLSIASGWCWPLMCDVLTWRSPPLVAPFPTPSHPSFIPSCVLVHGFYWSLCPSLFAEFLPNMHSTVLSWSADPKQASSFHFGACIQLSVISHSALQGSGRKLHCTWVCICARVHTLWIENPRPRGMETCPGLSNN